jgi:hypothetical protein
MQDIQRKAQKDQADIAIDEKKLQLEGLKLAAQANKPRA